MQCFLQQSLLSLLTNLLKLQYCDKNRSSIDKRQIFEMMMLTVCQRFADSVPNMKILSKKLSSLPSSIRMRQISDITKTNPELNPQKIIKTKRKKQVNVFVFPLSTGKSILFPEDFQTVFNIFSAFFPPSPNEEGIFSDFSNNEKIKDLTTFWKLERVLNYLKINPRSSIPFSNPQHAQQQQKMNSTKSPTSTPTTPKTNSQMIMPHYFSTFGPADQQQPQACRGGFPSKGCNSNSNPHSFFSSSCTTRQNDSCCLGAPTFCPGKKMFEMAKSNAALPPISSPGKMNGCPGKMAFGNSGNMSSSSSPNSDYCPITAFISHVKKPFQSFFQSTACLSSCTSSSSSHPPIQPVVNLVPSNCCVFFVLLYFMDSWVNCDRLVGSYIDLLEKYHGTKYVAEVLLLFLILHQQTNIFSEEQGKINNQVTEKYAGEDEVLSVHPAVEFLKNEFTKRVSILLKKLSMQCCCSGMGMTKCCS